MAYVITDLFCFGDNFYKKICKCTFLFFLNNSKLAEFNEICNFKFQNLLVYCKKKFLFLFSKIYLNGDFIKLNQNFSKTS